MTYTNDKSGDYICEIRFVIIPIRMESLQSIEP